MDELPKGLVFSLLDLVPISFNSTFHEGTLKVVDKLGAKISLGIDRILGKSHEPVLYGQGQDDWQIVGHCIWASIFQLNCHCVDPKPCFWVPISIIHLDAFWAKAAQPVGLSQIGGEGLDAIYIEWFIILVGWRVLWWSTVVVLVVMVLLIIADAEAPAIVVTLVLLLFFLFMVPCIEDVTHVADMVDRASSFSASLLASLSPLLTTWTPTGGSLTGQRGLVSFLMVLNSSCHHHHFDPGDGWCGSVVLGQHGLDHFIEHLGGEDVLLRDGEDVLVTHLCLADSFLDTPPLAGKALVPFFLLAWTLLVHCRLCFLLALAGGIIFLALEVVLFSVGLPLL